MTHHKETPEAAPPPTSIVFPRPIQILMPNDLCDNMQGALQYWVNAVMEAPYDKRQTWNDKVVETREAMREAGCG